MALSNTNAMVVTHLTQENGGGTFNPDGTVANLTSGYVLSLNPEWTRVLDLDDFTPTQASIYFHDFAAPGLFVGTWVNEGQVHLDVVTVEEDFDTAMHMAEVAQQEAIYDLNYGIERFVSEEKEHDPSEYTEWQDLYGGDDWDHGEREW